MHANPLLPRRPARPGKTDFPNDQHPPHPSPNAIPPNQQSDVVLQLSYRRFGTSGPANLVVSPGTHVTYKSGAKTGETFAVGMPHAAIDDAISAAVENRASEAL